MWQNSKIQNLEKKNSYSDKTWKIQNFTKTQKLKNMTKLKKNQHMTKLKNTTCDKI